MTAVFDIGKTNKKLFVFDDAFQVMHERSVHLSETQDEDEFPCEDLQTLTRWMKDSLSEITTHHKLPITKINFSAYGASLVHLDKSGNPVAPLYNYLKPFPENLKAKFYSHYGSEETVAQETASPVLGNLNSGMQLYRLKYERPEVFQKTKVSLHLPQYLASIFHGHFLSEITSIGCHTQLWDFKKQAYHHWVIEEQLDMLFPPIAHGNLMLPLPSNGFRILCGIGLHDSSAALIPYLASFTEPFILLSTGTWCIALNPFQDSPLTSMELQQDCLCYLSYQGKPVKASRLFLGHEHDDQIKRLASRFHVQENYFSTIPFNSTYINRGGQVTNLNSFPSAEQAYHGLLSNMVDRQVKALSLVLNPAVSRIFVDGGFSQNDVFMNLLAQQYPQLKIFGASVPQASALGAALTIAPAIPSKLISLRAY
jgi:L-fuculokinase